MDANARHTRWDWLSADSNTTMIGPPTSAVHVVSICCAVLCSASYQQCHQHHNDYDDALYPDVISVHIRISPCSRLPMLDSEF